MPAITSTRTRTSACPFVFRKPRNSVNLAPPMKYILFLVFAAMFGRAATVNAQSAMAFTSSKQSFVGAGLTKAYSSKNADTFFGAQKYGDSGVHLWVKNGEDNWDILITAPRGKPFVVGQYLDATEPGTNGSVLCFFGCGRGNNKVLGSFKVLEIAWGPEDTVRSVALDFIQYDNAQDYQKIVGSFRYHSTVPITDPKL